jgi:cytochrome c553
MNRGWLLAIAVGHVLALTAHPGVAQNAGPAKPDLARAQQIVTQVCAACHGVEGVSVAAANPHLAGQHPVHGAATRTFQTGVAQEPRDGNDVRGAEPRDARALGAYYADKAQARHREGQGAGRDRPENLPWGNSKTGLPACASCHSPTGAGMPPEYPRLAGQYADYTYAQLQGFVKVIAASEIKAASGKLVEDVQRQRSWPRSLPR